MKLELTNEAQAQLKAERAVIAQGKVLQASGGAKADCEEYDRLSKLEQTAYDALNDRGLTEEQWALYDDFRRNAYAA